MLKTDGVVAMTIFEKHDDSMIRCINRVLGTLIPGELPTLQVQHLRSIRVGFCVLAHMDPEWLDFAPFSVGVQDHHTGLNVARYFPKYI